MSLNENINKCLVRSDVMRCAPASRAPEKNIEIGHLKCSRSARRECRQRTDAGPDLAVKIWEDRATKIYMYVYIHRIKNKKVMHRPVDRHEIDVYLQKMQKISRF